ncbi:restriction endonuclease subunit S [Aureispira anguillae]|uniref:Restriction endonuclease subunit S n=1 Tax=Aureispira anguillae TaxID=2864201 RepID=A0A915YH70_9BACT|nr:restriction endonuclease subunit S [Aureispira anguillae]BDS13112.1 restriction endonuclease subunit S [Aureispira anguillae]
MEKVQINDEIEKIQTWNPKKDLSTNEFDYIDLSSVDKNTKEINDSLVCRLLGIEAPSRARQLIHVNDVLVSTVRPNLNGVALVSKQYKFATASTGYCVLRPKENLNSKYLFYWVQSPFFIKDMTNKASGASYPAVSDRIIKESKIPLPPLAEQKRIANILDQADQLRQLNQQILAEYDALTKSLFLDMFGDPVVNPMGWDMVKLKNCNSKIGSGATPKGGKESYKKNGISLIRSMNVYDNYFQYKDLAFIDDSQANKLKNVIVQEQDVLFNITGASVCRCTIVPNEILPARVNQHVAILRPVEGQLNSIFLSHLLISTNCKSKLLGISLKGGATREAITKESLQEFEIILPPITLQNQFAEKIKNIEAQKAQAQAALAESENLFNCLLQKAFKGDL